MAAAGEKDKKQAMSDSGAMEIDDVFAEVFSSPEPKADKFLLLCGDHLGKSKDILKLVKKRYKDCDPDFAVSEEFSNLVETTIDKIVTDSSRIFVHLKHFLNELKEHKCLKATTGARANKASSDSVFHSWSGEKKGTKRQADSEIPDKTEQLLKHPRLGELGSAAVDEEYESSDSDNELPEIIRNATAHKNHTSERCRSESPSVVHSDEGQNPPQNWRDFKFKKSVMTSIQAAASSFSSRLSKTIFKANKLNIRTSGSKSDSERIGTISCGSISSSSRTPSPSLISGTSSGLKCSDDNGKIQQLKPQFATDKTGESVEVIGSTEITSTTANLDSDVDSSDKYRRKSPAAASSSNFSDYTVDFKNKAKVTTSAKPDVKPGDISETDGYTVEMNVSSDEDVCDYVVENDYHKNNNCLNEETIDFTASDNINISSESNESDKHVNNKAHESSTKHFSKQINGTKINDKPVHNGKHSRARHSSTKSQSSVILIETDEESTSSDSEEIKPQLIKTEQICTKYQSEVDVLFEDSDSNSGLEKTDAKCVKTLNSNDAKMRGVDVESKTGSDKHEYRRITLTKVDSVEDEKKTKHSSDDEEKDQNFPSVLGLISVKKLKEKLKEENLKKECRKKSVVVSIYKLDEKTKLQYLGPEPSTSSRDKGEEGHDKAKAGKGSKRQIQELEKLLMQIRDKIEEVREHELGVDELDDEASDYILEDKLKKKFVAVFKKLCQLHKAEATTGRPTEKFFRYEGTRYPEINKKITRFINKRQEFPDFQDVRKLIVRTNKAKGLNLRRKAIDELSREAFTDVGNRLQRRRHEDFMATFNTPFTASVSEYDDPALLDPELKRKLDANKKDAKNRMDAVVEKYTQLQHKLGDRDLSDDDSDISNNDDIVPEKPEISEPEEPDLILIEDGEPVAKQGLGLVSRSGRAPLLMESSQLEIGPGSKQAIEIVNDEEEDLGPYFEETQVDDVGSPTPANGFNPDTRLRSWPYENETLVVSEEESVMLDKSENESTLSPDMLSVFNEGDELEIVTDYSDSEDESDRKIGSDKFTDTKPKVENKENKLEGATKLKGSEPSVISAIETHSSNVKKRTYAVENISETVVKISVKKGQENPSQTGPVKLLCNDPEKAVNVSTNLDFPQNSVFTSKDNKQEATDRLTEYIDEDLKDLAKQITEKQHNSDSDSDVEIKGLENVIESGKISSKNTNCKVDIECNIENISLLSRIETAGEIENPQPVLPDKIKRNLALSEASVDQTKEGSVMSNDITIVDSQLHESLSADKGKNQTEKSAALSTGSLNFSVQKVKQFMGVLENNKTQNVSERLESSAIGSATDLEVTEISGAGKIINGSKQTAELTAHKTNENLRKPETVKSNVNNENAETANKNSIDDIRTVEVLCIGREHIEQTRTNRSESPSCISIDSTEDIPVPDNSVKSKIREKNKISGNTPSQSSVKIIVPPKDHVLTTGIAHTKDNVHILKKNSVHTKDTAHTADDNDSDIEIIEEYNINDEYYDEEGEYYPDDNQASYYDDNSSKKDSQSSYFDDNSSKNLNYTEGSYSYDESGLDWEEEDYPLDSTSSYPYANENTGLYGAYEEEITSTFGDPADFKAHKKVTKEQFRAACVTLKKPIDRKPTVSQIRSIKREESLDLIEIYDEPDSTPYADEMEVSSSCLNEPIVLSDSE